MSIFCLFLQKTGMGDKPTYYLNFQLFVYSEFIVPLENFSLIWIRHQCQWRAANFDICSALMAIEQWGFLNVPQPLRHGPTVYNGHLRGPVTLTPVAERLAVELFYDCRLQSLRFVATGNRTLISRMRGKRSTSTPLRRSELSIKISYNLVVRENALYSLGLIF